MNTILNEDERDPNPENNNNRNVTWNNLSNNMNKNSMDRLDGLLKNSVLALKKPTAIQQQSEEYLQLGY